MNSLYPDWLLERILLDEVPPHLLERARLAQQDPEVQVRLETMRQADQRFREISPTPAFAEIRRIAAGRDRAEAAARRQARRRRWGIGVPVAALGLVVAIAPWHGRPTSSPALPDGRTASAISTDAPQASSASPVSGTAKTPDLAAAPQTLAAPVESLTIARAESGIRAKGDAVTLSIHRQGEGKAERLVSGDTVHPHDLLQISLEAQQRVYACIVSLDATGSLTAHFPESVGSAIALDPGKHVLLPHAYELDESRGFERFWLVWSDKPFETAQLSARLRALPPARRATAILELPAGFSQASVLLPKAQR